jgi:hypothetical protein
MSAWSTQSINPMSKKPPKLDIKATIIELDSRRSRLLKIKGHWKIKSLQVVEFEGFLILTNILVKIIL